ncbi:energy-coupling factor transporter ATPase [Halalkalibacillus halophilus]|uniref:energy-coupling factor transporter ATPase n=1 Tax=Halalkalibacillus halophilus TaxID=392827 RepID=UPI0004259407|nr:energy-coupling factor transporter ATPase [Halalkalibacillus halophilus]
MISFQDVSFQYKESDPYVLKNINLEIEQGEWVSIVGHNGSGKSTAAKLMNGLAIATEGEVVVDERAVSEETIYEIRRKLGMVFQNPENQFVGTTVADDVAFGMENLGVERSEMEVRLKQSLEAVRMKGYEDQEPHRLSGGQKQRIAIAGILAMQPEVIVFDEATTMLDPRGKKDLLDTIQELRKERNLTIVTITHDLNEASYSDRVIVLNQGEVHFEGTPRKLLEQHEMLPLIGLEAPFVTELHQQIKKHGLTITHEPLHYKELVDELWKLHLKK